MKKLVSLSGSLSCMWLKGQCRAGARGKKHVSCSAPGRIPMQKATHFPRQADFFLSSPLSAASNYLAHNNESKRLLCCCCSLSVRNPLLAASNFSAAYLGIISMGLIKSHRRASTVKLFFLSPSSKIYQDAMRASSLWTPQRDIFRLFGFIGRPNWCI